jgi:hypothetical protein
MVCVCVCARTVCARGPPSRDPLRTPPIHRLLAAATAASAAGDDSGDKLDMDEFSLAATLSLSLSLLQGLGASHPALFRTAASNLLGLLARSDLSDASSTFHKAQLGQLRSFCAHTFGTGSDGAWLRWHPPPPLSRLPPVYAWFTLSTWRLIPEPNPAAPRMVLLLGTLQPSGRTPWPCFWAWQWRRVTTWTPSRPWWGC